MAKPSGIPDYNHRAFITMAESYGKAAFRLAAGPPLPHAGPIGTLACQCMELSLKAVLLSRGATAEDIIRHGHKLKDLLKASELPWDDLDPKRVSFYADAMLGNDFRYLDMRFYYNIGDGGGALSMCEIIFSRCLEAVLPGAKRTLRR